MANVLVMVGTVFQMAGTAVLFVCADGEHCNVASSESDRDLVSSTCIQKLLQTVPIHKDSCQTNGPQ